MLGNAGTEKLTYDWKLQLTALSGRACDAKGAALPGLACKQPIVDVRIAAWLVRPDSYETSDNPCPPLAVCCTSSLSVYAFHVRGPTLCHCACNRERTLYDKQSGNVRGSAAQRDVISHLILSP